MVPICSIKPLIINFNSQISVDGWALVSWSGLVVDNVGLEVDCVFLFLLRSGFLRLLKIKIILVLPYL